MIVFTLQSQQIQLKMMKAIFHAIAYGSDDAKLYIPYILQLSELKNNNLTKIFNEEHEMVPEWMFISYISQMLSNYDFEQDCYLDNLLLKLAVKYPNGECVKNVIQTTLTFDSFSSLLPFQTVKKPLPK